MGIRDEMISILKINDENGSVMFGPVTVAYHCDTFNTRIIKGFEDTLGYEHARELVLTTTEISTYDPLSDMLNAKTQGMSFEDSLKVAFDFYRVIGCGSFELVELKGKGGKVKGVTFTAEGWFEKETKWNWNARKEPVCHVEAGLIATVWEVLNKLPKGSVSVKETACKAVGNPECIFEVEVK